MSKEFSMEQIQALMRCISENQIGELLLEGESSKLRIRGARYFEGAPVMMAPAILPTPASAPTLAAAVPAAPMMQPIPAVAAVVNDAENCAISPLVGTFYASSAPDKEAFVKVGQQVQVGEVLFIVESMKVMNEVLAERSGIVAQILVDNGSAVEYGQPIIRFE